MRPILRCFVTPTHLLNCCEGWADFKGDNYSKSENELALMASFIPNKIKSTCTPGLMYSDPKAPKIVPQSTKKSTKPQWPELSAFLDTKGQLITECLFDILNFPKNKKTIWQISVFNIIYTGYLLYKVITLCLYLMIWLLFIF